MTVARLAQAAAACAVGANLWFLSLDRPPPTFDAAWYLETACRLYRALAEFRIVDFVSLYAGAFKFKAPLISVLPLPIFFAAGPGESQALWVHLACIPALAAVTFELGRRWFDESAGLFAALTVLTLPLLFGLSRIFVVEYPLTLTVAASVLALSASKNLTQPGPVRALGWLTGFGLLLKVLFPYYMAGPAASTILRAADARGWKALEAPLKSVAVVAGLLAATWYAPNLVYVAGYLYRASFGDIAELYGTTLLRYWLVLFGDGLSWYYALSGAGFALWALGRSPLENFRRGWRENEGLRLCLLWILIPFAVASLGKNKDIRFMAPCLPAFAVLLGAALSKASEGRRTWAGLFFILPALQFSSQTTGRPSWTLKAGPFALYRNQASYTGAPSPSGRWGQEEFTAALTKTLAQGAVVVLGVEHPYFNANTLSFLAQKAGRDVQFINYGYAYKDVAQTTARLRDKEAGWLLLVDGLPADEIDPSVLELDAALRRLVAAKRLPFTQTAAYDLAGGVKAVLYRADGPIPLIGDMPR